MRIFNLKFFLPFFFWSRAYLTTLERSSDADMNWADRDRISWGQWIMKTALGGQRRKEAQAGQLEAPGSECWAEPGALWFSSHGFLLPLKFCHQKHPISTVQYSVLN